MFKGILGNNEGALSNDLIVKLLVTGMSVVGGIVTTVIKEKYGLKKEKERKK